jgi:hypothetical protein
MYGLDGYEPSFSGWNSADGGLGGDHQLKDDVKMVV